MLVGQDKMPAQNKPELRAPQSGRSGSTTLLADGGQLAVLRTATSTWLHLYHDPIEGIQYLSTRAHFCASRLSAQYSNYDCAAT